MVARIYVSKNPAQLIEVLLLQNWRKKLALYSLHVRHPGLSRGLSRSSRHLKPISLAEDLPQGLALRPKKIGTWDSADIAKGTTVVQDTLFNRRLCKAGRIPYRTVRMISRAGGQRYRIMDLDARYILSRNRATCIISAQALRKLCAQSAHICAEFRADPPQY